MISFQETISDWAKVCIIVQRTKQNWLIFYYKKSPPLAKWAINSDLHQCRAFLDTSNKFFIPTPPVGLSTYINKDNTKEYYHKRVYCTLICKIIIALGRIVVSWKETIHSKTCISGICVRLSRVRIFPGILGAHQQMIKYQSIINAF